MGCGKVVVVDYSGFPAKELPSQSEFPGADVPVWISAVPGMRAVERLRSGIKGRAEKPPRFSNPLFLVVETAARPVLRAFFLNPKGGVIAG